MSSRTAAPSRPSARLRTHRWRSLFAVAGIAVVAGPLKIGSPGALAVAFSGLRLSSRALSLGSATSSGDVEALRRAAHGRRWRTARRAGELEGAQSGLDLADAGKYIGVLLVLLGLAAWFPEFQAKRDRAEKRRKVEVQEKAWREERARKAYVAPREEWTEEDLKPYDGTQDPDGPILIGVDGIVLNVWKGRQFYMPGAEYHIFAGRDATRLLARGLLEEEKPEEAERPLNIAEKAQLETWKFTLTSKYDNVGKLVQGKTADASAKAGSGA
eukprot:TRINITY_DN27728_c0_g2_i1.p1 TRINITY_DN27728_c0_g2~~TRINITY_DN27728_c0_g2_i1.p1  ORF type:complete len:288 (-),score=61.59 TRINITY_DN27728_c0_g2_i1:69-881(-)